MKANGDWKNQLNSALFPNISTSVLRRYWSLTSSNHRATLSVMFPGDHAYSLMRCREIELLDKYIILITNFKLTHTETHTYFFKWQNYSCPRTPTYIIRWQSEYILLFFLKPNTTSQLSGLTSNMIHPPSFKLPSKPKVRSRAKW